MSDPMAPTRMPPRADHADYRRMRRIAGLALAGTLTACASLGGNGKEANTNGAGIAAATFDGLPNGLATRAMSVLDTYDTPPASVLEARRRADRAASTLQEFLAAEGYFAATVTPEFISTTSETPRLAIDLGKRFRIASVGIDIDGDLDADTRAKLDTARTALPDGAVARTSDMESLNTSLVSQLKESGYAFAASQPIDALASRADSTIELTYALTPGPRVTLGQLVVPDDIRTREKALRVLRTWKPGETYTPERIRTLRTRLRSTGLYDGIGIDVSETPDADGNYPVNLLLSEGKPRSVGIGASVSTTEGAGVDAYWERRNVTGRGDTVRVEGSAANLGRSLTGTYELPNIGRYGRTLTAELGARGLETDAYDIQGVKLGASLAQPFNKNFTISAGAYVDATHTIDYRLKIAGPSPARDQVTFSFPLSATYDTVADKLDPQGGNRMFASLEPAVSTGSVTATYSRFLTSASTYHLFAEDLVGAARAEFGAFFGDKDVPADRLFFAGGGGSVRGYPYQSLSPHNIAGAYVGGTSLFDASMELRWRKSERFGYAAFVDTGAATLDTGDLFSDMRTAAGLGIRYYPGFGPIRFDIATPLNRREGDDAVQVYISIGQAF
ncbi:MAG: autotransporter assembly complex family protein [Hyphomonas sp.]|nr:outer membrane protein assembly factor [Hyphomonas sp.]MCC0017580.1 outer membrane protein assembly factor [Rhodobiaceae bacterium]